MKVWSLFCFWRITRFVSDLGQSEGLLLFRRARNLPRLWRKFPDVFFRFSSFCFCFLAMSPSHSARELHPGYMGFSLAPRIPNFSICAWRERCSFFCSGLVEHCLSRRYCRLSDVGSRSALLIRLRYLSSSRYSRGFCGVGRLGLDCVQE